MELLLGVPEDDPHGGHAVDRGRRHVQVLAEAERPSLDLDDLAVQVTPYPPSRPRRRTRPYRAPVNPPVVHASTVLFADASTMARLDQKYTYGTRATPTSDALTAAIDALEGSAGTVAVPSGLAAVVLPLMAYLSTKRSCADRQLRLPTRPASSPTLYSSG